VGCIICSAPLATSLFLSHNEALVPPYRIIVDTNFINLSLENRMDMVKSMMDALYAKCESMPLSLEDLEVIGRRMWRDSDEQSCDESLLTLSSPPRHPLHLRLCYGRAGEAWPEVPSRPPVRSPSPSSQLPH
jgi:hypothetical protein